ncbi:MAG: cyanoexosortase A [Microcoleaceae cyanobacterium]
MKVTYPIVTQQFKTSPFWLLTIGSGLIAIHVTLAWRGDNLNVLGAGILFWVTVASMIWQRRYSLKLESSAIASGVGLVIISLILLRSLALPARGTFYGLMPLLSGLGVGLLASDFRGLKQYWGELTALFFIGAPELVHLFIPDISPITAKFSAFLLWYLGFEARLRNQVYIDLPGGGVEVYSGCSGIDTMTHSLGLAVLFLLMFSSTKWQKVIIPIVALGIGFTVNIFRVVLMAALVSENQMKAFDYWHKGDGSLIFSLIAVFCFGGFCYWVIQQNESKQNELQQSDLTGN